MKISKKLIILVMSSTSKSEYVELEESIKKTWYNLQNDDVEIIFYKDNQNLTEKSNFPIRNGCDLILPLNDGFYTLNQKTLMAFDWVSKNYEFEYLYRSNLGAFVDIEVMLKFLDNKPKIKFYCGVHGVDEFYFGRPVRFISGSGYFLSKDLVNLVLQNTQQWPWQVVDDVALGYILIEINGIKPSEDGLRKDICDDKIEYIKGDKSIQFIDDNLIYHYRLRSNNRSGDITMMNELYKNKNR
jgi:hypothetical protein